jgi:hypothetical protein
VITVTSESAGNLKVKFNVEHNIVDVSNSTWSMRTTLTVQLIDLNSSGTVFLRQRTDANPLGAVLIPEVLEDDGFGGDWVTQNALVLGNTNYNGEGTTGTDSGSMSYTGTITTLKMRMQGDWELSSGDRAIITGRFEITGGNVPVEGTTWGRIKALYGE